ncbi:substrate-binding domain-containing protein [Janibacter sp. YB324]|uniref:substrate-binding domain-containing protein n=1 Tax=Janibacter sp. YB324 TaxID=2761047 RepID=UPI0016249169|nr:substrate-binding domain-containing protein [Janibacter sp. YB324]QNF93888.1 substrate-binding domain-containing protein [Janibacter sp. YB324]
MSDGRPGRRHDLWDEDDDLGTTSGPADTSAAAGSAAAATPTKGDEPAPSRHSRRRDEAASKRKRWLLPIAALLVLALCGGGAFAAFGRGGDDSACGGDALTVAATPEIADALEDALDKVREQDECANFDVSATSAADAAQGINDGTAPDVWIPDSSTWIDAVDPSNSTGQWLEGQSIASSPVVLATSDEQKRTPAPASPRGPRCSTRTVACAWPTPTPTPRAAWPSTPAASGSPVGSVSTPASD